MGLTFRSKCKLYFFCINTCWLLPYLSYWNTVYTQQIEWLDGQTIRLFFKRPNISFSQVPESIDTKKRRTANSSRKHEKKKRKNAVKSTRKNKKECSKKHEKKKKERSKKNEEEKEKMQSKARGRERKNAVKSTRICAAQIREKRLWEKKHEPRICNGTPKLRKGKSPLPSNFF